MIKMRTNQHHSPPVGIKHRHTSLEQLLQRQDIWRGHTQAPCLKPKSHSLSTGFNAFDAALLHSGWPLGQLVEVCQPRLNHAEWLLLRPALQHNNGDELLVLLNPPFAPFAQGLIQAGVNLERLRVVECGNKADFLAGFIELTQASACHAVLAWQPQQPLTYTELRKCLLATHKGKGLYLLFRSEKTHNQSSPASLRLSLALTDYYLQVRIFKQRGMLTTTDKPLLLPLPRSWQPLTAHNKLNTPGSKGSDAPNTEPDKTEPAKIGAKVMPLKGGRGLL